MKKQCNKDISHCYNIVSLTPNENVKKFEKYKNIDPDILLAKFRKLYTGNYRDSESISEAKAMLQELYRTKGVTWAEYIFYLDRYITKVMDGKKIEIIYLNNKNALYTKHNLLWCLPYICFT